MADKKISALTSATTPLARTEVFPIVQSGSTVKTTIDSVTPGLSFSSNRNLGLNTTLAGADSRFTNFELGEVASLSSITVNSTTQLTYLQHNSYVDGSGVTKFKAAGSNYAMQYSLNGSTHYWQTSTAAGTGGNNVTYNTLMQLSASGDQTLNLGNWVQGTAAKGVNFTANTPAAGKTSQLLNWYEEGTWTPSLGGTATYNTNAGTYTRIGRVVVAHFVVDVATLGTGSGTTISGLPFASFSSNRGSGNVAYVSNPASAFASINLYVPVNSDSVEFVCASTAGVWTNGATVFQNGAVISGTVTYFV